MREIILTSILFLFLLFLSCKKQRLSASQVIQSTIDNISLDDLPKGLPFYALEFEDSIQLQLLKGEIRPSISYHKHLQIGKYKTVKESTDLPPAWGLDSLIEEELNYIKQFELKNAYEAIAEQAELHKLIIITESHYKPEHRVFMSQLLTRLYDRGYRHLGLENVLPAFQSEHGELLDSNMLKRGYPLLSNLSGIYTSEPHYANIIREAHAIGFSLFGYEQNGSSESERDLQQAEHVIEYQRLHPGEKIICYGGWSHAIEEAIEKREGSGQYWLGYHYKNLTGDDPLTIYQDAFNDKSLSGTKTSPYYEYLARTFDLSDFPKVLIDAKGAVYNGNVLTIPVDILVVNSPVIYDENGLPNWLNWYTLNGTYQMEDIALYLEKINTYPVIISIREAHASKIATPIHTCQMDEFPEQLNLPLRKGNYVLRIKNVTGEIEEQIFHVE